MRSIEATLIDKLGESWLSNGRSKDAGFGILKAATALLPPDAIVFVTGCNMFEPTERMLALSPEEQRAKIGDSHGDQHRAVAEGWLTVHDGLTSLAQTPQRVCIYAQKVAVGRRVLFLGQPDVRAFDQSNFDGRMKMFGAKTEDYEFIFKKGYRQ
jgi:hypothetical protein